MTEIGHMRSLLAEMEGLSAQAPRAQEGNGQEGNGALVDFLLAGQEFWNKNLGFAGPNYVRTKCVALLSVGSGVLPDNLRDALLRVEVKLNEADSVEREGVYNEAAHKKGLSDSRWAVYNAFKGALPHVKEAMKSFGVSDGLDGKQARAQLKKKTQNELKNNDYAVALSEFVTAMHQYLGRYIHAESLQWEGPAGFGVERVSDAAFQPKASMMSQPEADISTLLREMQHL